MKTYGLYERAGSTVEAMRYLPINAHEVAFWCSGIQIPLVQVEPAFDTPRMLHIISPTGVTVARYGDYVVKDPFGKFYAFKPDIFESTYTEKDPANNG